MWSIITSNYTAVDFDRLLVDCSSASVTITLPSSPSTGESVVISDFTFSSQDNNITINRNGSNILADTENLILDVNGATVELVYSNSTVGWMVIQR